MLENKRTAGFEEGVRQVVRLISDNRLIGDAPLRNHVIVSGQDDVLNGRLQSDPRLDLPSNRSGDGIRLTHLARVAVPSVVRRAWQSRGCRPSHVGFCAKAVSLGSNALHRASPSLVPVVAGSSASAMMRSRWVTMSVFVLPGAGKPGFRSTVVLVAGLLGSEPTSGD